MRKAFRIGLFCLTAALLMPATPVYAQCVNPAGNEGDMAFNETHKVAQYCDSAGWVAMLPPTAADDCKNIGEVCADGTIYAGLTPDGNVRMYTTASDIGTSRWASSNETTALTSNTDGDGNTIGLVNFPGAVTYDAAQDCYDSSAEGYYDWYLPARNELLVLYTNRLAIGNFDTGGFYWSSSENTANNAREVSFVNGTTTNYNKGTVFNIRCVRSDNSKVTEIVPSGLVGHWRLDEITGIYAFDSSSSGNDGTYNTGTTPATDTRAGVINRSIQLNDDSNDRIDVPGDAAYNNLNEFTISAWINTDNIGTYYQGIVEIAGVAELFLAFNSMQVRFGAEGWSTQAGTWQYAEIPAVQQWVHVAVTYDYSSTANAPKIYVDGVEQVIGISFAPSGTYTPPVSPSIAIGSADIGGWRGFRGKMDDVRIYNRILSADEITEIYEARNGIRYNETANVPEFFDGNKFVPVAKFNDVSGGLVGHWKLDETTGTTAVDSSGNGNDGTMLDALSADTHSTAGAVGKGINFTGNSTYINVTGSGFPLDPGEPFTMSAWASADIVTGLYGSIMLWGRANDSPYTRPNIRIYESAGSVYLRVGVGNNVINDYALPGFAANVFELYTVTYDGTDMEAFRNGVSLGSWTPASPIDASENMLTIGARANGAVYNTLHRGTIDDVRLYSRVLSDDEIMTLYAMGAPLGQSTALPQGCPNIGDVCDDGTIYAGTSPDGSVEMFTTPEDAGLMYWNNDNTNYTDVTAVAGSASAGMSNTLGLVVTDSDSVAAGFQTHFAAQYCYDLEIGGSNDWYLPAPNELVILYNNRAAIGNFDVSGEEYWTSRTVGLNAGSTVNFNTGNIDGSDKHADERVRCVRKGPAPRCANPYGLEGSMFYNTTHDVMQYCDGARWVAIGKRN